MLSLYSTWTGLFRYSNPKMPLLHSTVTFRETGEKKFIGFASEEEIILPDDFKTAIEVKGQNILTPWGSKSCDIIDGELLDKHMPKWGQVINFVKAPDQLSGYPVFCRGGFNEVSGLIVGVWGIVEGITPCGLPLNLKTGAFTFKRPDDGRRRSTQAPAPVQPELLPA